MEKLDFASLAAAFSDGWILLFTQILFGFFIVF